MNSIIYSLATRRVQRVRPVEELRPPDDGARLPARARQFRKWLLFLLVMLGVISFTEVVLLPGRMIRGVAPDRPPDTLADKDEKGDGSPYGFLSPRNLFMSDAERQRQQEVRRQRIEQRIRGAHARLGNAIVHAQADLRQSADYLESRLKLPGKSVESHGSLPLKLVPLIAAEPTAQQAWADMLKINRDMITALDEAQDLHRLIAERFAGNSYLDDDDNTMTATLDRLNGAMTEGRRFKRDIDHLSVLLKGRAALAHLAAQTGELP